MSIAYNIYSNNHQVSSIYLCVLALGHIGTPYIKCIIIRAYPRAAVESLESFPVGGRFSSGGP